ncbi:hypothetical protein ACH347_37755 [Saccharopolyspora sp. 5N102]|uniref:hypothetical protein n=1 Tax=Saccharopolyspora sp. 5N102 TaxID=3375155 RepID=UPI0037AE6AD4
MPTFERSEFEHATARHTTEALDGPGDAGVVEQRNGARLDVLERRGQLGRPLAGEHVDGVLW